MANLYPKGEHTYVRHKSPNMRVRFKSIQLSKIQFNLMYIFIFTTHYSAQWYEIHTSPSSNQDWTGLRHRLHFEVATVNH